MCAHVQVGGALFSPPSWGLHLPLSLLVKSCVSLGKLLYLSEPWFLTCKRWWYWQHLTHRVAEREWCTRDIAKCSINIAGWRASLSYYSPPGAGCWASVTSPAKWGESRSLLTGCLGGSDVMGHISAPLLGTPKFKECSLPAGLCSWGFSSIDPFNSHMGPTRWVLLASPLKSQGGC